ncbi:thioesterase domain-containing protein [Streptomyces smyrnaeus]|uniref:thioesterase domain-containing protein n=1 Tax=Streptomyces smyrnaeus TaxID=1387713 RepID=UPI0033DE1BE9
MADDYIEQIRQVRPSGPYHLIGWSPGGLVATPPLSASANRARRSAWWPSSARHRPAPRRPRRANWRRAPSSWSSWGPPTMTPAHYAPRAYPPKRRPRSFCAAATEPWLIWGSTGSPRSSPSTAETADWRAVSNAAPSTGTSPCSRRPRTAHHPRLRLPTGTPT